MLVKISPYLIALSIGLMIGIERERSLGQRKAPMGVRSFMLLALAGAVAGAVDEPLIALGLVLFVASATLLGYWRATEPQLELTPSLGLTTELSAMMTFGLGFLSSTEPVMSLALAGIIFTILTHKDALHKFTKERLRPDELQAATTLVLLAFGLVPLLPDQTIDPLNIFNPHRLGVLVAIIAGIQFISYAASLVFGSRLGMPISGFIAGLMSSTAAFLSYAKIAQSKSRSYVSNVSAGIFAILSSLVLLAILVATSSPKLFIAACIPLLSIMALCLLFGVLLYAKAHGTLAEGRMENPLNIRSAVKLALILTFFFFIIELAQRYLGELFTGLVSFIGSLFELHGVAVASANMYANDSISIEFAVKNILLAIIASIISKIIITGTVARGKYRQLMLVSLTIIGAISLLFLGLVTVFPSLIIRVS